MNGIINNTISLCSFCKKIIDAKIVIENNSVYIDKFCEKHGNHRELLEEDASYHLIKKEYDKEGTKTTFQTKIEKGCPFDCGLCPEHKQHTCNALIDITSDCDLHSFAFAAYFDNIWCMFF